MDEINALRQQLAAAEFLVNSLRGQLQRAEEQFASQQEYHSHYLPRGTTEATASSSIDQQRHVSSQADLEAELQRELDTTTPRRDTGAGEAAVYPTGQARAGSINDNNEHLPDATHNDSEAPGSEVEEGEPAEYPIPEGMTLPDVSLQTIFPDLSSVKTAAEAYALAQGWTPATKKRDRTRICIGCRTTPNCTFHVRAETCVDGARISASNLLHTCQSALLSGTYRPKRQQVTRMRFLREEVPKLLELTRTTPTKDIQDAVFQRFGTRPSLGQCSKLRGPSRYKRPGNQGCSKCGLNGHNVLTCKA